MNVKQLASLLHLFLCDYYHEDDLTKYEHSDKCTWDIEESFDNPYMGKEHIRWQKIAEELLQIAPDITGQDLRGYFFLRNMRPKVFDFLIRLEECCGCDKSS